VGAEVPTPNSASPPRRKPSIAESTSTLREEFFAPITALNAVNNIWDADTSLRLQSRKRSNSMESGASDRMRALGSTQKLVLTGGPCAGKTTALARLSEFLRSRQFNVFVVPEAATMLWSGGASVDMLATAANRIAFQSALMNIQIALEDQFSAAARMESARTGRPSIVICDRGLLDGKAYMDPHEWAHMLSINDIANDVPLRDARYHAVLHMVTAAKGAEAFYTLENNLTRTEDIATAASLDDKLQTCWSGHPRLRVFDNSTDFEGKMQRVVHSVSQLLGMPASKRRFRRFLLVPGSWDAIEAAFLAGEKVSIQTFEVEKVYVTPVVEEVDSSAAAAAKRHSLYPYAFVRKRQQGSAAVYGHTLIRMGAKGMPIETKRIMSARGYVRAVATSADPSHTVVRQRRSIFMFHNQYCEVNEYLSPDAAAGLCLLSVQATQDDSIDEDEDDVAGDIHVSGDILSPPTKTSRVHKEAAWLKIPSFFRVQQEVTGERAFSAHTLSRASRD
jgi:thymidylate kinase